MDNDPMYYHPNMLETPRFPLPSWLVTDSSELPHPTSPTPPPATEESLDRYSFCHVFESRGLCQATEEASISSRLVCPLCLECVHGGDEMRTLPCLHAFHRGCVDRWLAEYHRTCPMCRADLEFAYSQEAEAFEDHLHRSSQI